MYTAVLMLCNKMNETRNSKGQYPPWRRRLESNIDMEKLASYQMCNDKISL